MKGQGFEVVRVDTYDTAALKKKFGVPETLEGCHTAVVGRYVFEGLLPAGMIRRVLEENRPIKGIALPGMPTGAPACLESSPSLWTCTTYPIRRVNSPAFRGKS